MFQPIKIQIQQEEINKHKELLQELVKAANIMNTLFMQQSYSKNSEIEQKLKSQNNQELLQRFYQHFGPFNRADHNKPFIQGHVKPKGANLYPEDLTKEELQAWITNHPEEKAAMENEYTIVRRKNNNLITIPYHEFYKEDLQQAANHLRTASTLTNNKSLQSFLEKRAESLLTDNYFESEIAWMDLNSDIEITIGPYEVYEDELQGRKTAYEACICLVDKEETHKLQHLEAQTNLLEQHLPLDKQHHNHNRGKESPIKICNLIYSAGDAKAGIHFTAFNLPNDERVREAKGSKKVLLKNIAQAKFDACWIPITKKILNEETRKNCTFEAYFMHILLHEISHGLGPGTITKEGKQTSVNNELKETYSFIEEAKADVLGVHNAFILAKQGILKETLAQDILVTFIAGIFRSIRFGIGEAHGGANIMTYNYLEDYKAVKIENNKLLIDQEQSKKILEQLAQELLEIEATGDYKKAKQLLKEKKTIRPQIQTILNNLKHIPIDIIPEMPDLK